MDTTKTGIVTRSGRRLSVDKLEIKDEDIRSTASTPTKKRTRRLSLKPELEDVIETDVLSSKNREESEDMIQILDDNKVPIVVMTDLAKTESISQSSIPSVEVTDSPSRNLRKYNVFNTSPELIPKSGRGIVTPKKAIGAKLENSLLQNIVDSPKPRKSKRVTGEATDSTHDSSTLRRSRRLSTELNIVMEDPIREEQIDTNQATVTRRGKRLSIIPVQPSLPEENEDCKELDNVSEQENEINESIAMSPAKRESSQSELMTEKQEMTTDNNCSLKSNESPKEKSLNESLKLRLSNSESNKDENDLESDYINNISFNKSSSQIKSLNTSTSENQVSSSFSEGGKIIFSERRLLNSEFADANMSVTCIDNNDTSLETENKKLLNKSSNSISSTGVSDTKENLLQSTSDQADALLSNNKPSSDNEALSQPRKKLSFSNEDKLKPLNIDSMDCKEIKIFKGNEDLVSENSLKTNENIFTNDKTSLQDDGHNESKSIFESNQTQNSPKVCHNSPKIQSKNNFLIEKSERSLNTSTHSEGDLEILREKSENKMNESRSNKSMNVEPNKIMNQSKLFDTSEVGARKDDETCISFVDNLDSSVNRSLSKSISIISQKISITNNQSPAIDSPKAFNLSHRKLSLNKSLNETSDEKPSPDKFSDSNSKSNASFTSATLSADEIIEFKDSSIQNYKEKIISPEKSRFSNDCQLELSNSKSCNKSIEKDDSNMLVYCDDEFPINDSDVSNSDLKKSFSKTENVKSSPNTSLEIHNSSKVKNELLKVQAKPKHLLNKSLVEIKNTQTLKLRGKSESHLDNINNSYNNYNEMENSSKSPNLLNISNKSLSIKADTKDHHKEKSFSKVNISTDKISEEYKNEIVQCSTPYKEINVIRIDSSSKLSNKHIISKKDKSLQELDSFNERSNAKNTSLNNRSNTGSQKNKWIDGVSEENAKRKTCESDESSSESDRSLQIEFLDSASDAGSNYKSGDSMDESLRREMEDNQIIERGESIGSESSDVESDVSSYEKDSFICSSEDDLVNKSDSISSKTSKNNSALSDSRIKNINNTLNGSQTSATRNRTHGNLEPSNREDISNDLENKENGSVQSDGQEKMESISQPEDGSIENVFKKVSSAETSMHEESRIQALQSLPKDSPCSQSNSRKKRVSINSELIGDFNVETVDIENISSNIRKRKLSDQSENESFCTSTAGQFRIRKNVKEQPTRPISLSISGSTTAFSIVALKKTPKQNFTQCLQSEALNFKQQMLYGKSIKRKDSSNILKVQQKQQASKYKRLN